MADASTPEVRLVATPEGQARVRVLSPDRRPLGTVLLSHGAGGQRDSADLTALAGALPLDGWVVVLVDQPWRVAGRRVATAPPRLDAAYVPVVETLVSGPSPVPRPLVSAGRSAGARVVCRTAHAVAADAVLAVSFPLHPPGRPDRSRYEEIAGATRHGIPVWVVQGEGDAFGTPEELRNAGLSENSLREVRGTHTPHPGDVVVAAREVLAGLRS